MCAAAPRAKDCRPRCKLQSLIRWACRISSLSRRKEPSVVATDEVIINGTIVAFTTEMALLAGSCFIARFKSTFFPMLHYVADKASVDNESRITGLRSIRESYMRLAQVGRLSYGNASHGKRIDSTAPQHPLPQTLRLHDTRTEMERVLRAG